MIKRHSLLPLVRRCGRAQTMRGVIGSYGSQISTGGGTDLPTSTQSQFFSCPDLQIIALHDYNLDSSYVASYVDAAKASAISSGQRLLYEEFGATGSSKQSEIEAVTNTLISVGGCYDILIVFTHTHWISWQTGVPWMYWEV